jgi:hypothetical protein
VAAGATAARQKTAGGQCQRPSGNTAQKLASRQSRLHPISLIVHIHVVPYSLNWMYWMLC